MDERRRRAERRSQVERDPAAQERWEAEQERLGGLLRFDRPELFFARLRRPRWETLEAGGLSAEADRIVVGPIGRPMRHSPEVEAHILHLPGIPAGDATLAAARRGELRGLHLTIDERFELEALEGLQVERLSVTVDAPLPLAPLRALPITALSIGHRGPELAPGELAALLPSLPHLSSLHVEHLLGPPDLHAIAALTGLRRLSCWVSEEGLAELGSLAACPLRELELRLPLADEPLAALADGSGFGELERLALRTIVPGEVWPFLERCGALKDLELEFLDDIAVDLGTLPCAPELRALTLKGVEALPLRGLEGAAELRFLALDAVRVELRGAGRPDRLRELIVERDELFDADDLPALVAGAAELERAELMISQADREALLGLVCGRPRLRELELRSGDTIEDDELAPLAPVGSFRLERLELGLHGFESVEVYRALYERHGAALLEFNRMRWGERLASLEGVLGWELDELRDGLNGDEDWLERAGSRLALVPRLLEVGRVDAAWALARDFAAETPCAEDLASLALAFAEAGRFDLADALSEGPRRIPAAGRARLLALKGLREEAREAARAALGELLRGALSIEPFTAEAAELSHVAVHGEPAKGG